MNDSKGNGKRRPVALVTGGSKGIGFELAKQLARHGHDLVLVARDEAVLDRAARELTDHYQCLVTPVSLDLLAADAPATLFRRLEEAGIDIDVLVNNAGLGDYGPFAESDPQRLSAMLGLNVVTLSLLTRLFLPGMIARGRGRVLNVASLVAFFAGGPNLSGYLASKHYVLALTRGLKDELAGTGVSVTALCPGPAATDFVDSAGLGGTRVYRWLPKVSTAAVARAGYRALTAGRTIVTPGLVNKILAFLGELPPRGIAQAVFAFFARSGRRTEATGQHLPPAGY
jgi:short-subunit dehydrogenase